MATSSSTSSVDPAASLYWQSLARRTSGRINLAWWWQGAAPLLIGVSALACGAVLYLRSTQPWFDVHLAGIIVGGVILACAIGAFVWARGRFASVSDGLVQLEHKMKLNNALSSAAAGMRPWPEAPQEVDVNDGLEWRWKFVAAPLLILASSLALAFFLPITAPSFTPPAPIPPPTAVQQTENLLKELEKAEVARKEDTEKFKEALDSLKQHSPEEWYSHSSLEAADHLKESLSRAANDLGNHFDQAANSMEKLSNESNLSEAQKNQAAQQLADALAGMQAGGLQPNKELMDKMKGLDPKQLGQGMSAEQMQQMKEALKKNAAACKNCSGGKGEGGEGKGAEEQAMRDALKRDGKGEGKGSRSGNGDGDGEGDEGQEGEGGPSRGPGTVDLNLKKKASDLNTNSPEKEQTQDLSRLAPGDMLGSTDGEHDVDKSKLGPQQSGGTSHQGQGGDAVWKESLMPEEKRVLGKYFK